MNKEFLDKQVELSRAVLFTASDSEEEVAFVKRFMVLTLCSFTDARGMGFEETEAFLKEISNKVLQTRVF